MTETYNSKVVNATKWSAITETIARLVSPILSLVLARVLTPEAFGVVATVTMVITFAEIFTDAGFQKYLIQHEFIDDIDRDQSTNIAFWSNLIVSLLIWLIISIFRNPLAKLVGNPGLGYVLVIASVSIPLAAFSSIQMALYKRDLDFKTLFKIRLIGVLIPLFVTLPLALLLKNFWALIVGTIIQNLTNAVLLTTFSSWKPRWYYSFSKFKEMFSFTAWSMFEAVSIWLTSYIDVFVIGTVLSQYHLGLYKTTSSLVGQVFGIITASVTPVIFSSLSRLQSDRKEFANLFYKFQKTVALIVLPLGAIFYFHREGITLLLLGPQWDDAVDFVGMWGFTTAITLVYGSNFGEVYRALGRPKVSVLVQWLHIIVLVPVVVFSAKQGFEALSLWRPLIRFEASIVNIIAVYLVANLTFGTMLRNTFVPILGSIAVSIFAFLVRNIVRHSIILLVLAVFVEVCIYIVLMFMFPETRNTIKLFIANLLRK